MMNHYFYNGRQVGSAITLAGAQGTIHAVNQVIQMQQQVQGAKSVYAVFTASDAKCTLRCASSGFIFHSIWRDIFLMKESD